MNMIPAPGVTWVSTEEYEAEVAEVARLRQVIAQTRKIVMDAQTTLNLGEDAASARLGRVNLRDLLARAIRILSESQGA